MEGFNRNATTFQLPRLVSRSRKKPVDAELAQYSRSLELVYRAVSHTAGCDVLVDSSKTPSHALVLSTISDADLHVVHLVRDARAVVHSQHRKKIKPDVAGGTALLPRRNTVMSSLRWLKANVTAELLRGTAKSYIRVRYEDLVREPGTVLADILCAIGQTDAGANFDFNRISIVDRHNVAGNPMRFLKKQIVIKADEDWRGNLGALSRWTAACLCFPFLRRYGYFG